MKKNLVITTLFLIVVPRCVFAQFSCGGTPLLGSLDLPATAPGNGSRQLAICANV